MFLTHFNILSMLTNARTIERLNATSLAAVGENFRTTKSHFKFLPGQAGAKRAPRLACITPISVGAAKDQADILKANGKNSLDRGFKRRQGVHSQTELDIMHCCGYGESGGS